MPTYTTCHHAWDPKRIRSGTVAVLSQSAFVAGVALCLLVGGCISRQAKTGLQSLDRSAGAALAERAKAYWIARGRETWTDLYEFQPPPIKARTTVDEFRKWATTEEPFHIEKWAIKERLREGRFGWVRVDYTATLRRFPNLAAKETTSWQRWVLLDGQWYPVPQTELKNFPETPAIRDSAAEVALRARFAQTWNARRDRDWSALYSLTDPRDHDAVSLGEFTESESLFLYLDAAVDWVEVIGDRGKIRVTYTHKPTDPSMTKMPAQQAAIIENWIRVDEQWYRDLIQQRG